MKRARFRTVSILCLTLCLGLSAAAVAIADDWPQFRGPGGLGISQASALPTRWSDAENVVWKAEIPGAGASSPAVYGNRVFLTYQTGFQCVIAHLPSRLSLFRA